MTLQMALLEERMQAEARGRVQGIELGRNEGAVKLIRLGRPFDEIYEDTGLPLQRIQELAKIIL